MARGKSPERIRGDILGEDCVECPCFHLVVDDHKKIFKVFLEDCEGIVVAVNFNQVRKLCGRISEVKQQKLREASLEETDYLARKYLGLEIVEKYGEE